MSSNKFLQKHYEKIILALLLLLFSGLLYLQLSVIQESQGKKVDDIVNAGEPPADFEPRDYNTPEYEPKNIFDANSYAWSLYKAPAYLADSPAGKNVDLMIPIMMAPCPNSNCSKLIPISCFPEKDAVGQNSKCIYCGFSLEPRKRDVLDSQQDQVSVNEDENGNGIPDVWEHQYGIFAAAPEGGTAPVKDSDGDGFDDLAEFKAKTDPTKANSHPLYVTRLILADVPAAVSFGEFMSPKARKIYKNMRVQDIYRTSVSFAFIKESGSRERVFCRFSEKNPNPEIFFKGLSSSDDPNDYTTGFRLIEAKDGKVVIESLDKRVRFVCKKDEPIVTDYKMINLTCPGTVIDNAKIRLGDTFVLGTDSTGKEKYTAVSLEGEGQNTVLVIKNDAGAVFKIKIAAGLPSAADAEKEGGAAAE